MSTAPLIDELTRHQKREVSGRRDELGEPVIEIARSYNVSRFEDDAIAKMEMPK
jgi:hypothetical protein